METIKRRSCEVNGTSELQDGQKLETKVNSISFGVGVLGTFSIQNYEEMKPALLVKSMRRNPWLNWDYGQICETCTLIRNFEICAKSKWVSRLLLKLSKNVFVICVIVCVLHDFITQRFAPPLPWKIPCPSTLFF